MRIELCAVLLLGLAACHGDGASAPPAQKKTLEPIGGPASPPAPAANSPIVAELEREASNRPTGTPSVESVMGAIESAGIKLEPKKQVFGTMNKAHYCVLTKTPANLSMSICEYDDEAQAKAGMKLSQSQSKTFPNRVFEINAKTLLTLNLTHDSPEVSAERDRVLEVFKKLSAK
jgi:hypothetical protein